MKIKWLGHACFQLTTSKNTLILIDPADFKGYHLPHNLSPNIVTISHNHIDHNKIDKLNGKPEILRGCSARNNKFQFIDTTIIDVRIYNIKSFHDKGHHGDNAIFILEFDDIRIAHFGDIGILLTEDQINKIGKLDVVMIPVGIITISA
ncbi:MBL fold metallo-hydrolase [Bacteroidota bacterium]